MWERGCGTGCFERLLPVSLFLVLFDLAAGSSFRLMELSLLGLLAALVCRCWEGWRCSPPRMWNTFHRRLQGSWVGGSCLLCYLAWDAATGLRSWGGFWEKYRVVGLMLALSACLLLYLEDARRIDGILWTVTAAGVFSSVFSLLNYAFLRVYPLYYGRRLSLRVDYNMFSLVVMMGLVTGFFLLLCAGISVSRRILLMLLLLELTVPAVVLSASRRNFLLLFPLSLVFLLNLFLRLRRERGSRFAFSATVWAGTAAALMLLVTVWALGSYLDRTYEELLHSQAGELLADGESSPGERYSAGGAGDSKRGLLWSIAVRELADYCREELLAGKGFGYDRHLYLQSDDPALERAYSPQARQNLSAHCFVLTDLLNGGVVLAVLGLSVWILLGLRLLVLWRAYPFFGQMYLLGLGLVFLNNLISNRFGNLYDKYFWIFWMLTAAELRLLTENRRRV